MLERALAYAPAACGCLNFFCQGTSSIKPIFFDMYRDKPKTKYNEGERTAAKTKDSQVDCTTIGRDRHPRKDRARTGRKSLAKGQLRKQKTDKTTGNRATTTVKRKRQDEDR